MNTLEITGIGLLVLLTVLVFIFKPKKKKEECGVRKITLIAMLLAMAIALGLVESAIPGFFVPGFRIGIANVIILIALYGLGIKEALLIDILRVVIVCLIRGSIFSMGGWMSMAGAALSFLVMAIAKIALKPLTVVGVSILGALAHDVGQILIALIYLSNKGVFYYLPFMALVSLVTGTLLGLLANVIIKRKTLPSLRMS